MSQEYLFKTAFETICFVHNLNHHGIVEGVKLLIESQESTGDFIDWNIQFCGKHNIFAPAEMDFYNHAVVFLYQQLGKSLDENGINCVWLEFKDLELEAIFEKVEYWENCYFLVDMIKKIPFQNRSILLHWFYAKLTS